MVGQQSSEPEQTLGRRLARRMALIGPAFLVGATQFGPGNITASSSVGASYGYSLIWLVAISTIFMLIYTDMSVRIGLSLPESPIRTFKSYGPVRRVLGTVTAIGIALTALLFNIGSVLGAALGMTLLFPGGLRLWTAAVALVALALVAIRNYYTSLEKVMVVLVGAMIALFAVTGVATQPEWPEVGAGFIPTLPDIDWTLFVAILGTNFSITASIYAAYATRQKKTPKSRYRDVTLTDTIAGVVAPAIMTILIIIASANVFSGSGEIDSATDMAHVLESTLGSWARVVFGLGIFAAGFTSVIGNATGGSFLLADAVGWEAQLNAPKTRLCVAGLIVVPAVVATIFSTFPIQTIITANALTIVIVPLTGIVVLMLANDRRRMGKLRNKPWQNVLGVIGWAILVAGVVQLVRELLFS